jgi:hypothetical protein
MKRLNLLAALICCAVLYSQTNFTSFEEPPVFSVEYIDTGDPLIAHDLLNNQNEPFVNYTFIGDELGFSARYEPYNTPGDGLTDGDLVGVTEQAPSLPFPDGEQGYEISDVDGNFILEFDPLVTTSPTILIDYFINETGYEGDGTTNTSGSDRLRIYVKDLDNNIEYDLLDTTGSDINDLGIEGNWNTASLTIEDSPNINIQLIIEARTNSGAEAFYFDNILIEQLLNVENLEDDYFSIYPNPTQKGHVNIVPKTSSSKVIVVYDVLGKELIHKKVDDQKLDVSNLMSGIYFVKINHGTKSITKKLVVK